MQDPRLLLPCGDPFVWNAAGGPLPHDIALGESFTVKVSITSLKESGLSGEEGPHLVYDKKRSLVVFMIRGMNCTAKDWDRIADVVRKKGMVCGRKGYFKAVMKKVGELHIFPGKIKVQGW